MQQLFIRRGIQTLPPELLAEIFLNFLPSYPKSPPYAGTLSPLFLCRICRQWRLLALSTPALWRAISLEFYAFEAKDIHIRKLELLNSWMTRSKNCALSLAICVAHDFTFMQEVLQAVVAQCRRWEHITLQVPAPHMPLIQGDMPRLRTLDFGPTSHPPRGPLTLFDRAPQLRSVVLTIQFRPSAVPLPWAQLTHLEAHRLYEHECLEILTEAKNLVRCKVSICSGGIVLRDCIPAHPHLCHLSLFMFNIHAPRHWKILDRLTLPALRTLLVSEPCMTLASMAGLISRSQCALDKLHVTGATLAESAFRNALPPFGAIVLETLDDGWDW
ncbi:hypothetical protein C8R46DRAFT_358461 [Mycena filopes]|nr:hypothetical protein C8R46DRAFT_358461 [Mycena filopes]